MSGENFKSLVSMFQNEYRRLEASVDEIGLHLHKLGNMEAIENNKLAELVKEKERFEKYVLQNDREVQKETPHPKILN